MLQPLSTVPISGSTYEKLSEKGFLYYEDILESPRTEDVKEEITSNLENVTVTSALDCWQMEQSTFGIATMSHSLDSALGNGIKLGSITEVCGLPGSGKTQLCLQLCVSVQIPTDSGGLGGEAVYIDTTSNFSTSRLREMASGCWKQVKKSQIPNLSVWEERVLKYVHYIEAYNIEKFCASIELLIEFLEDNPSVKLIVIDSITAPFKDDCSDVNRTGLLYRTAVKLRKIAWQKNIAVVITNEMSTRIGLGVVGALGDTWAHCVGIRIIVSPPGVAVTHNSQKPDVSAKIKITKEGIRDLQ